MAGSGLEEVFGEIYGEATVTHMFSGKAVARALRAHMLVQGALVSHLINDLVDEGKVDPSKFEIIYEKVMASGMSKEQQSQFGEEEIFLKVKEEIGKYIERKKEESRTAKLWLLYIEYDSIVKEFILAERTCNWYLHIKSVSKMMNLFSASGHINYAKSSRIYVQEMLDLSETNPWLEQQFQEGHHAVRRTSRCWAGLWSDLVIEQTLIRSLKSRGGLTRGRGFNDSVRHL